jgi:nicotinate-nucleotide adenylyltransferase
VAKVKHDHKGQGPVASGALYTSASLKIGLLGGSFNPAHEGHRLVSLIALRKLELDQIWWLVSPQNPLKSETGMAPLAKRLEDAQSLCRHPRIIATDIETTLGTCFTIDTVNALQERFTGTRFVWLMGADNMITLPQWKDWRALMETIPVAVYPRPGYTLKARLSAAATTYRSAWVDSSDAKALPLKRAPALCFLDGPENPLSATSIRQERALIK